MVPDSFFNFAACLMSDKVQCPPVNGTSTNGRSHNKREGIDGVPTFITRSSQRNHSACKLTTCITKKRSNKLITLNNKLGMGISYDSLQRQLTLQSANIMQQIKEEAWCPYP